ncbi:MAG: dihydroorotase [Rickettsiales bacterium]|nr:dihydroorotase [Rickettsiales bacterium]
MQKKTFDLILRNGKVVFGKKTETSDIGIIDSKIASVGNLSLHQSKKILDISNLHVLPGCIDTQVHFREPGFTHKEDIKSGSKGAILGGITGFFEMPNTDPPTINEIEFKNKISSAKKNSYCNFGFYIGASKENAKDLQFLETLPGCAGVKIFMGSSTGSLLVEDDENLEKIFSSCFKNIAIHSEDEYRLVARKKIIDEANVDVGEHEIWRDSISAIKSTKRLINLSKKLGRKIHILHISTQDEIKLIKKNKKLITAEVTPQHLFFNSPDCYKELGTLAQMNPPIRNKKHQSGLWKGIQDGVIDVIGSDHAPHTLSEKNKDYPLSPSGMVGVQTLVPVMLDFVNQKKLSIFDFVRLTCVNPCKIFNIMNKGKIKKNYDADFTVVDLNKTKIVENNWIASKSGWTPYDGKKLKGWPSHTIIGGEIVMQEGEILKKIDAKPFEFGDID